MIRPFKILSGTPSIDFLGKKTFGFIISCFLILGSFYLLATKGLNFGIDFTGGILIEARFDKSPNIATLRQTLRAENIGDISIQTLGDEKTLMIRIGQQEGSEADRMKAVEVVKKTLTSLVGGTIDYRKVDYVGPKVGAELIIDGATSLCLAFIAILIYIWFRFEWQYGAGAVLALLHDSILTLGFFSLLQLEFNLSSIAAILTIIGYSINDSVVIFDRIRENVRKYKKLALQDLLNRSINDNLARTLLTSITTMLALCALVFFGGDVIKSFSLAALFGVIVGTYSSIYIASPVLIFMKLRTQEQS